jgi:hypothetical protein
MDVMLNAAFNYIAGFDHGSDTPKKYKDVLKHTDYTGWQNSNKRSCMLLKPTVHGSLF